MLLTQSQTQREFQIDLWQLLWPRHFQHLNIDLEGKQSQYAGRNILFPNWQGIPSPVRTTTKEQLEIVKVHGKVRAELGNYWGRAACQGNTLQGF